MELQERAAVKLSPVTHLPLNTTMNTDFLNLATLALLPAAMLTFTSCSTTEGNDAEARVNTDRGAAITVEKP